MKSLLPIGATLGLLPTIDWFSADELETSMTDAGFDIDYRWRPAPDEAVFIVARKPAHLP